LRTKVENIIETNITVENLNEQIAKIDAMQTQNFEGVKVDKCPGYDKTMDILASRANVTPEMITAFAKTCDQTATCGIDQNLKVSLLSQQITENLVKAIQEDEVVQSETAVVVNDVAPKSSGLASLISSITGAYLAGAFACCCCVFLAIMLLTMNKKPK
jgi:hypothetical protein